jgi:hypothetical protein
MVRASRAGFADERHADRRKASHAVLPKCVFVMPGMTQIPTPVPLAGTLSDLAFTPAKVVRAMDYASFIEEKVMPLQ